MLVNFSGWVLCQNIKGNGYGMLYVVGKIFMFGARFDRVHNDLFCEIIKQNEEKFIF